MKRETAEKIIAAAVRIDGIFEELGTISQEIEDEAERRKIRRALATSFSTLYEKLTREVALDFPDLHPDFPEGDWKGGPLRY